MYFEKDDPTRCECRRQMQPKSKSNQFYVKTYTEN